MRVRFQSEKRVERNALDLAGCVVGTLLHRRRGERKLDCGRGSRLVSNPGATGDCTAKLGFRAGVDDALRADGYCRLADLAGRCFSVANIGPDSVPGATGSELCLVVDLLSATRPGSCACRSGGFVGGYWSDDLCIRTSLSVGGLADGALSGLGDVCERVEWGFLEVEPGVGRYGPGSRAMWKCPGGISRLICG